VLSVCGQATANAGVAGYAQTGRGALDIFDRCMGREGQLPEQRVVDCTTAIQSVTFQGYSAPRFARAIAYEKLGKYDLAIADLAQASQLGGAHDQNRPGIYNDLCFDRAVSGGSSSQALADCNRSLELRPGDPSTLDSRALVELQMKNYAAVISDANAVLAAKPKLASSLYMRGIARLNSGDATGGNADIAAAKAIDPRISATYANYGVSP
jgi:tetratricopeptide (TPR) repeat protein